MEASYGGCNISSNSLKLFPLKRMRIAVKEVELGMKVFVRRDGARACLGT
jgi:hypothetical protein